MHSKIERVHERPSQARLTASPRSGSPKVLRSTGPPTGTRQAEMVMRDAVLNRPSSASTTWTGSTARSLMYKEGQNAPAVSLVARTAKEKILLADGELLEGASFTDVFKLTIGKNYEEFDKEWMYALKKQYYPLLAATMRRAWSPGTSPRRDLMPSRWSFEHDSPRDVIFMGNRTGYTGIYEKNIDSKDPKDRAVNVIQGERTDEFEAFHPLRGAGSTSRARHPGLRDKKRRDRRPAPVRHFRRQGRAVAPVARRSSAIGS